MKILTPLDVVKGSLCKMMSSAGIYLIYNYCLILKKKMKKQEKSYRDGSMGPTILCIFKQIMHIFCSQKIKLKNR